MANQPSALIVLNEYLCRAAVSQSFHDTGRLGGHLLRDPDRTLLIVMVGASLGASCIPERTGQTGMIQQAQLPAGIDAVRQQWLTVQAVDGAQIRLRCRSPQPGVPRLMQSSRSVEQLPGDARLNRWFVWMPAVAHAADGQGTRVHDRQGRGVTVNVHGIDGPSLW